MFDFGTWDEDIFDFGIFVQAVLPFVQGPGIGDLSTVAGAGITQNVSVTGAGPTTNPSTSGGGIVHNPFVRRVGPGP